MLEVTQFNRIEFETQNPEIFNVCKDPGKIQEMIDSVTLQINNALPEYDLKPLYKAKAGFLFVKDAMDPNSELNQKLGGKDNVLTIRVLREESSRNVNVAYVLKVPERTLEAQRQAEEQRKLAERLKEEADKQERRAEEQKRAEAEQAKKAKRNQSKQDRLRNKDGKAPKKTQPVKPSPKKGRHASPKTKS